MLTKASGAFLHRGLFLLCVGYDTNLVGSNSPERPVSAVFGGFIDDRRLSSFMTRVGLNRRPEQGTRDCSFDCRCKDTEISGIYQILACDKKRFSAKLTI